MSGHDHGEDGVSRRRCWNAYLGRGGAPTGVIMTVHGAACALVGIIESSASRDRGHAG